MQFDGYQSTDYGNSIEIVEVKSSGKNALPKARNQLRIRSLFVDQVLHVLNETLNLGSQKQIQSALVSFVHKHSSSETKDLDPNYDGTVVDEKDLNEVLRATKASHTLISL